MKEKLKSFIDSISWKDFIPFYFWTVSILIWELALHFMCYRSFSSSSLSMFPFILRYALVMTLIFRLFPEKWNFWLSLAASIVLLVFYSSQIVYNRVFADFYSVSMVKLGGTAIKNFWKQTVAATFESWWKILIFAVPVGLCILQRKFYPESFRRRSWVKSAVVLLLLISVWSQSVLSLSLGGRGRYSAYGMYYRSSAQTKASVNRLGMMTTMRLELFQMLFPRDNEEEEVLVPIPDQQVDVKSPNIMKFDFNLMKTYTGDSRIIQLNNYFSSIKGSNKNKYTGMFEGYNLIEICAESYSPVLISEELTPTLYKLTHEGIVFTNYYTSFPNTTTNCEYALCMGLFPDMTRNKYDASFKVCINNYLPFCVGNEFRNAGYNTMSFHNYIGSYFGREFSHPNMGFTCYFAQDGMEFTDDWPASDLEMVQQSLDYIYEAGEPFVGYYMTFSGHYRYDFHTNPMCIKNQERVADLPYSDTVKAYIACNLELEDALTELMRSLDEHGMLDHTVIVMTGDHYPYGLLDYQYNELAGEELPEPFGRMKNSLIIWAAGMEDPIVCDNYCCNVDILPTVLNLFGMEYDSRMLAGTDILSDAQHIAILTDESFMTDKMMFNSTTNEITYFVPEEEIPINYFENMVQLIQNKMNISNMILYTNYYDFAFHPDKYLPEQMPTDPTEPSSSVPDSSVPPDTEGPDQEPEETEEPAP